jgi:phosphate transport system substrate-binding protein
MRTFLRISLLAALAAACGQGSTPGSVDLQGAGATFPYPLYSKWMAEYAKVSPRVRINYQAIGSGGGIKQITERTVDFGATDAPMSEDELKKAAGPILHIPMTIGAVVVAYNLPSASARLRFTPDLLAAVFLGEITSWGDPRIAAVNPGVALPADPITLVYRSDGSGTTAVFTSYLAAVSPVWKEKVGAGKSVKFPAGLGAKGNEGVAGQIKTTPGAIGYGELAYARQTGIAYASMQNAAGQMVEPTLEAVSAAAASFASGLPEDLRASIVNAPGAASYPIASFSYILVYADIADRAKGQALAAFLWWAIHDGQQYGPGLDYAPLPAAVVGQAETKLRSLRAGGQPAL